ncbi:hypothetical protein PFISCL1PPCAC_11112, partial [Pristionchus fissidentatus]
FPHLLKMESSHSESRTDETFEQLGSRPFVPASTVMVDMDSLTAAIAEVEEEEKFMKSEENFLKSDGETDLEKENRTLREKLAQMESNEQFATERYAAEKTEWQRTAKEFKDQIANLEKTIEVVTTSSKPLMNEVTNHTFRLRFTGISQLREDTRLVIESKPARIAGVDWVIRLSHDVILDEKVQMTMNYMSVWLVAVSNPLPE